MDAFQRKLVLAVAAAGLAAKGVLASEFASEKEYLREFPVVLSASRLSQPLSEAPNAVTVIDREMIKASGFRTISDLFRLVPGMYVGYENGHAPIVAYHGSNDNYSRRMQVLVDGRSIYLPPYSMVNWEDLPLHISDIERIEVVRGPAAASYGANSFQGVINIITRDPSSAGDRRISATKGNGGISDMSAHFGRTGASLDYRVTLAYRADDGFDTDVLNDRSATRLASVRANYQPGAAADSFDFQLGLSSGAQGWGIAGRDTNPFVDARTYSSFQQVTWLHALPQFDEFRLNYYHIHRRSDDGVFRSDTNVDSHRHELEFQHTSHQGTSNRLVWGAGKRIDSADAASALASPQSLYQSRLFAHDEWRINGAAVLNAGAMLEDDGMGHRNTSPRASLNYHVAPQHTLRAGTSVAYRSPAILEEKIDIPGQYLSLGGLRPERIHSKEVGYLGEFTTAQVTIDARVYFDHVTDVIFIDPSPLAPPFFDGKPYGFANLLSTDYRGFEGTARHNWSEGSLIFSYSRQYASCAITGTLREPAFLPKLQEIAGSCPAMVPRNSGSILLAQEIADDIQVSAGYYHQGAVTFLNTPVALKKMRRLDLRAARTFGEPLESGSGEVALVVQNILRNDYTEFAAVPQTRGQIMFNRRIFVTAMIGF